MPKSKKTMKQAEDNLHSGQYIHWEKVRYLFCVELENYRKQIFDYGSGNYFPADADELEAIDTLAVHFFNSLKEAEYLPVFSPSEANDAASDFVWNFVSDIMGYTKFHIRIFFAHTLKTVLVNKWRISSTLENCSTN